MSKTTHFDYTTFFNYYSKLGIPDDEVRFQQYRGQKVDNDKKRIPFDYQNYHIRRIPDSDPLIQKYPGYFKYHGFISIAPDPNDKQAIYIIHPFLQEGQPDKKYLLCNHLSYIIDKNDKKKPLHFHQTLYSLIDDTHGNVAKFKNYIPTELSFTRATFGAILRNDSLKQKKDFLYDVFTKPFKSESSPEDEMQTGSGLGQARRKPSKRLPREAPRNTTTNSHSSRFIKLWQNLPLKHIIVISFPSPVVPGTHEVSVIIEDRLRHKPNAHSLAVYLRVPSSRVRNHKWLEADIADVLKDFTYDSFRDKPDYDTDEEIMRM
jgi:hypothetical protein